MLLALQTTSEGIDDGTLDALTLALLVGFVISLVALSLLLARRNPDAASEREPERTPEPRRAASPAPTLRPLTPVQPKVNPEDRAPAWLAGVVLPRLEPSLSESTAVIERLLAARRAGDLATGVALYTPAFRANLANELGVPVEDLDGVLGSASIHGEPPSLRSVELLSAGADTMSVRAGYADRSSETYRLARIDGRWLIESIERG